MAQEEIIFPNNIRNIRLAAGMKMTELARRSNLSLSAVSKIEKGVRRLNQKQLLNICNILGCKLSDIFIKDTDEVASKWQNEINRRMNDNEDGGLKVFGTGLRKIRQQSGKTIAQAAKDAGMTLQPLWSRTHRHAVLRGIHQGRPAELHGHRRDDRR